jgi:hypothetical protein
MNGSLGISIGSTSIDNLPSNGGGGGGGGGVSMQINEQQVQSLMQGGGGGGGGGGVVLQQQHQHQQHQQQQQQQHQQHQQVQNEKTQLTSQTYNPNEFSANSGGNTQQQQPPNNEPLSQEQARLLMQGLEIAQQQNLTKLQSRDIPQMQNIYTQDPYIRQNVITENIPATKKDYIENENLESFINKYNNKELQKANNEDLYNELQTPLLIMILFFIFQLPFFNKYLFIYMPSLFIKDGHLSLMGFVLKTLLFGSSYYLLIKSMNLMI